MQLLSITRTLTVNHTNLSHDGGFASPEGPGLSVAVTGGIQLQQPQSQSLGMYNCNSFILIVNGVMLLVLVLAVFVSRLAGIRGPTDDDEGGTPLQKPGWSMYVCMHRYGGALRPCGRSCWSHHWLRLCIHVNVLLAFIVLWAEAIQSVPVAAFLAMIVGAIFEVLLFKSLPRDEQAPHHTARNQIACENHDTDTRHSVTSFFSQTDEQHTIHVTATAAHAVEVCPTILVAAGTPDFFSEDIDLEFLVETQLTSLDVQEQVVMHAVWTDEPIMGNCAWTQSNSEFRAASFAKGKSTADDVSHATILSFDDFDLSMPLPVPVDSSPTVTLVALPNSVEFPLWDIEDSEEQEDASRPQPQKCEQTFQQVDFGSIPTYSVQRLGSQAATAHVPVTWNGLSMATLLVWAISVIATCMCAAQYSATACSISSQVWPFLVLFICDGCVIASVTLGFVLLL